jgi:adenosylcobinamide-phosphate synthase
MPLHPSLVVLIAFVLDAALGDPPDRLHPVAWMGGALAAGRRRLCRGSPRVLLLGGGVLTLAVAALAASSGVAVAMLSAALGVAGPLLEAVALKSTLSPHGLAAAARSVATALERDDLPRARAELGRHLVSRPTATLDAGQVASGAIESVAENLTDALIAPLVFFLVLGLPGALAYRALNTADTMLGYREGPLEYFGKVAARLDDIVNLLPARLAAVAIVAAAGAGASASWSTMVREHGRTASPNAGWTMSAMAGALGVTLAKPGVYRLGQGRAPEATDIGRSLRVTTRAATLAIVALLVASVVVKLHS